MLDDKHEVYRYMNGRKTIENTLVLIPQHKQASFIYECLSYMSENPGTPVPLVTSLIYKLWKKYERV